MSKRKENIRVRIARDVLEQIRLQRYVARTGTYVGVLSSDGSHIEALDEFGDRKFNDLLDQSFKKFFKENKAATCEVCALGSAFVSLVNIENKCSVGEMCEIDGMFDRLVEHFGGDNLVLMESAFECCVMDNVASNVDVYDMRMAAEWGSKYDDDTERLQAIMRNIIRNNGDFKLPKKLVATAAATRESERW